MMKTYASPIIKTMLVNDSMSGFDINSEPSGAEQLGNEGVFDQNDMPKPKSVWE